MHVPTHETLEVFNLRAGCFQVCKRAPGVLKKDLSRCGRPYASCKPLEQWRAQFGFEIQDAPVKGRRSGMDFFGRLANRSAARYGIDIHQQTRCAQGDLVLCQSAGAAPG